MYKESLNGRTQRLKAYYKTAAMSLNSSMLQIFTIFDLYI